ncbi:phage protease [Thermomonas sp. S9]|uniref:phage protease n=1 Tax=Thermomonas sp. S9 TaxID=2885203 RepID=UPI00216AC8FF|nr:phage protease [Thermomonas sp. S9]MCR6494797.1 phage protease [Thermomonas sp. S9]
MSSRRGCFLGRDGRGPYTLDAAAVLEAFARHGADLPIDYEHQSLTATDKAGPVPAAGWITALDMRGGRPVGARHLDAAARRPAGRAQYRYLRRCSCIARTAPSSSWSAPA